MLWIDQFRDVRTGAPLLGFFVRNVRGKIVATGATGRFLAMRHKRYANDRDLVAKCERLSPGLTARLV